MTLKFSDIADKPLPRIVVHVDEWDGDVLVRSLRASERSELEELFVGKPVNPAEFRKALLQKALINDDGTPWLANGDADKLMQSSAAAVEQLFDAALSFNGMTDQEAENSKKNL